MRAPATGMGCHQRTLQGGPFQGSMVQGFGLNNWHRFSSFINYQSICIVWNLSHNNTTSSEIQASMLQ